MSFYLQNIITMANTYSSIYVHVVFAVKNRESMLLATFRERVYQYISKMLRAGGHLPVAIGGTENHIHILIRYNVSQPLPDLLRDIKAGSSRFINDNRFINFRFEWQRGYGAFSHSRKEVDAVAGYIRHQPEHYNSLTYAQEMIKLLDRYDIEYDERYVLYDV